MNTWGTKIRLSIFGESHEEALGIVIDGLEAGTKLNLENINKFIDRRRAGKSSFTTSRKEKDEFRILSGYKDGHTTGAPLCVIFENTNTQSKDYENLKVLLRPNHADYPAAIKFKGFNDIRGGGHFSGRITLALTFALSPTVFFISATSSNVAPPVPKPVEVFTKSAFALTANSHAFTFSSSVI